MPALDFLESARKEFMHYRSLGERTFDQLSEADLFREPAPGSNSIAVIVKHIQGNMRSRWTDFLTTDGEKPWRDRDGEFEMQWRTREELMAAWHEGWTSLFNALDALTPMDLERIVHIRTEPHTVAQAIARQLAHIPYHIGQIVLLGKLFLGEGFQCLSIPKGASRTFNKEKGM